MRKNRKNRHRKKGNEQKEENRAYKKKLTASMLSSKHYDELLDSILRKDGDLNSDESIDLSSEEDARQAE